ncbi:hypothetical protein E2C01_027716 [Portunus trituberculatus]|uniref:Uncharacterized protein n=1 Tax=Portunus trituberculatus TaxID=210409 RepID=A0A5B7EIV0_PORTR|nr:hypothetical protein [Portunus trituberculatus]
MAPLWIHLKDLAPLNRRAEHLSVELLIRQDAPLLLTPLEVRCGRNGEPFAIRTKLGWAINGPLGPQERRSMSFNAFVADTTNNRSTAPLSEETVRQFWEVNK